MLYFPETKFASLPRWPAEKASKRVPRRGWICHGCIIMALALLFGGSIQLHLLLAAHNAEAQSVPELSAREIMANYKQQRNSRDEYAVLTMKLINSSGKQRTRKLEQTTMTDKKKNKKMLINVLKPEDIRGTSFLILEHKGSDNDQWLYLPAFRRVRRVLPNEKSDSFLGSDFSYEDLETEQLEHYSYRLLGEDSLDGVRCWIIEARPKDEKTRRESGYGKRELWIRCDNFVGLKTRFFDKKGKLVKIIRAFDIRPVGDGKKWRAYRLQMENLQSGHKTVLLYEKYIIDQGVPEGIFTRAYLERGR